MKMMEVRQRGLLNTALCVLVTFVLLFSLIPSEAFASESAEESVSAEVAVSEVPQADDENEDANGNSALADTAQEMADEGVAPSEKGDSADAAENITADASEIVVDTAAEEAEEEDSASVPELAMSKDELIDAAGSSEDDASTPNTAVSLGLYEPGTYTVTANVYVPSAENTFVSGIQAFLTNPINPIQVSEEGVLGAASSGGIPRTHVENNATLVVGEDRSLTLTIPIRNPVFTLQSISSGDGIEITSISRYTVDLGPFNEDGSLQKASYKSRINSITVKLTKDATRMADGNYGYRFGSCSEYATLLDEPGSVTLALAVGFDNVALADKKVRQPVVHSDLVYNGYEQVGVEPSDNTEIVEKEGETAAAKNAGDYSVTIKPKDGYMWVDSGTNEERTYQWSIAKAQLTKKFFTVIDNYGEYSTMPSAEDVAKGTVYEGFVGEDNESNVEGLSTRSFDDWNADFSNGVDTFIDYHANYTGDDADTENYSVTTDIRFHVAMSSADMPVVVTGLVYNGQNQIGLKTASGGSWKSAPWDDISNGVYGFLNVRTCVNAGTYTANLSPHTVTLNLDPQGYWADTKDQSVKQMSWTIAPAELTAKATDAYYVLGEGDLSLSYTVDGFVNGENAKNAQGYEAPTVAIENGLSVDQLEAGKSYNIVVSGGSADNYSFTYEAGTLYVLDQGQASEPQVNPSVLTYTGTEQQGVLDGIGFTVKTTDPDGNVTDTATGINAGAYTTVATLKDGYAWGDGSSEKTKTLSWEIKQAPLTAKYETHYLTRSEYDEYFPLVNEVLVEGFVNGETEETAADYVAPTLYRYQGGKATSTKIEDIKLTTNNCSIIPQGGSAKNYYFASYKNGTLWSAKDAKDGSYAMYPKVLKNLVYTGQEQVGVIKLASCDLNGNTGVNAGTYHATAVLDTAKNALWYYGSWTGENAKPESNKNQAIDVQWSISKASIDVAAKDVTVNLGDAPDLSGAYTLTGFVNGESVEEGTVSGFEAPVVTVLGHEGEDLSALAAGTYMLKVSGGSADNYEFTGHESATLTVLSEDSEIAADPQAQELTYNGQEQQGVRDSAKWTLSGDVGATGVGSYTTTVTLKEGYAWADGTEGAKTVKWAIGKATLTAAYSGEVIDPSETPNVKLVEVTGFVNGETASTADGYKAPSLSGIPSSYSAGDTFEISLSGGSATDYDFVYVSGTLSVMNKVDKPTAQTGLKYNGSEQTGVAVGEGYELADSSATNAGDYTATATLLENSVWADDLSTDPAKINFSIAKATLTATYAGGQTTPGDALELPVNVTGFVNNETPNAIAGYVAPTVSAPESLEIGQTYELTPTGGSADNYDFVYVAGTLKCVAKTTGTLKAGTYTITANLSMPGDYNPVLPGTTVYANNPNNPFTDKKGNTPVSDGNTNAVDGLPMSPVSKNATLIVGEDGSKTLILNVQNPVFTTQELGTCSELGDVRVTRTMPSDPTAWTYGKYSTRISQITVKLTDDLATGTQSYYFKGSKLYAVPLGLDIEPEGDIALELSVNYSSLPAEALPDGVTPTPDPDPTPDPGTDSNPGGTDSNNSGNNGNSNTGNGSDTVKVNTTTGHYAAGTYTVSGNIWLPKSSTGLPLNPHLSNGAFPPKDAVSNNATLVVESNGHAYVRIPIVIQSKVMTVNSITGSGVSYSGSYATIDLGYPTSGQTSFSGTCTVSVTIGDLAMTIGSGIFQGVRDHTYTANWEVNFGTATNRGGGGTMPASALAILAGVEGVSDEESATEAALAALDDDDATDSASKSKGKNLKSSKSGANGADGEGEEADGSGLSTGAIAGIGVGVAALAALGLWLFFAKRRKKDDDEGAQNA